MEESKIIRVGNGFGVTISSKMLQAQGLKLGDTVNISGEKDKISIRRSGSVGLVEGISEDFFEVLEQNVAKHEKTIRGLIDR